jgi:D-alanine-D-alanine ligase
MSAKIRVGVLLGGASAEREISLASGHMIAEHLPRDRYEVVTLDPLALMARNPHLTNALRDKAWALVEKRSPPESVGDGKGDLPAAFKEQVARAALTATSATAALVPTAGESRGIDVAFLALHGRYGEDGTLQGLLDLLGIPYVGSGTLASALAMDKVMAKKVLAADGVPVPGGAVVERATFARDPEGEARRAAAASLPAVVKPVTQGSSVGLSLVETAAEMRPALEKALAHDARALVEERLAGTEITVGVIGNRELQALPVVEIVPKHALFDYQAKYDPELSDEVCPARIPEETARAAQELAVRAHRSLSCRGLSRTDMIATARGPVVLEVNTLPGMTVNSLLPKAARVAGIPFPELLDRLVRLALEPED